MPTIASFVMNTTCKISLKAAIVGINIIVMNNTNATKELSYYEKNKEAYLKKCRNYYQANRDTIIIRRREWNKSNRSIISVRTRLYRESRTAEQKEQRKVKYNIWLKKKMSTDPGFKLSRYLRSSLGAELKKKKCL